MLEEKNTKFCPSCGIEIDTKFKACPNCGTEQPIILGKVSNWWYLTSVFLGITGGLLAWVVNKDINPGKAKKLLIIGIVISIWTTICVMTSIIWISLDEARVVIKEDGIISSMNALQSLIEIRSVNYIINEQEFSEMNCSMAELSFECNNIKEYAGEMPTINSSREDYCFYIKLPSEEYYCVSNLGVKSKTNIFPGGLGYCDGVTFSCP